MDESAVRFWMSDVSSRAESREWATLLEHAATGNLAAFEELMARTQHRVLAIARRILGNPSDAEEATQEVFLRVYKYLHRFDRRRLFEPWLYRLSVNVCNDIASRRARSHEIAPPDDREPAAAAMDPGDALDRDTQRELIQQALSRLSEKQ